MTYILNNFTSTQHNITFQAKVLLKVRLSSVTANAFIVEPLLCELILIFIVLQNLKSTHTLAFTKTNIGTAS